MRKGTSKDLKSKLFRRYFLYFFLYLIMIGDCVMDLTNWNYIDEETTDNQNSWWRTFWIEWPALFVDSMGIFLALARLSEPYVYQEFMISVRKLKKKIRKAFCKENKTRKRKTVKYSHEAFCSMVNSAMNIELVYIILFGISSTMQYKQTEENEKA